MSLALTTREEQHHEVIWGEAWRGKRLYFQPTMGFYVEKYDVIHCPICGKLVTDNHNARRICDGIAHVHCP